MTPFAENALAVFACLVALLAPLVALLRPRWSVRCLLLMWVTPIVASFILPGFVAFFGILLFWPMAFMTLGVVFNAESEGVFK